MNIFVSYILTLIFELLEHIPHTVIAYICVVFSMSATCPNLLLFTYIVNLLRPRKNVLF
jgi:hypothetical protein